MLASRASEVLARDFVTFVSLVAHVAVHVYIVFSTVYNHSVCPSFFGTPACVHIVSSWTPVCDFASVVCPCIAQAAVNTPFGPLCETTACVLPACLQLAFAPVSDNLFAHCVLPLDPCV